jgi:hypothetical protein
MNAQSMLIQQASLIKAFNPDTKIWNYRNLVKALPWFDEVREKINDPAYSGWFLHFSPDGPWGNGSYNVPQCDTDFSPPRCSALYHDQLQSPEHSKSGEFDPGYCVDPCDCGGVPCGEYLWDHRNESLREWLIHTHILGPMGLGNANVSGFYLDDLWQNTSQAVQPWQPQPMGFCDHSPFGGPTEEDSNCVSDMGLTQEDTTAIFNGWQETVAQVTAAIVENNGFWWQGFYSSSAPPNDAAQCTAWFTEACSATSPMYTSALQFNLYWDDSKGVLVQLAEDLASFMLVRGDYGFIGYGWAGCTNSSVPGGWGGAPYVFPPAFSVDYGVPTGLCAESAPNSGIFIRDWTKASVAFNCNTYTGKISMKD